MRSALKNFGVTFLVSLVLFGIIAYFATSLVTGTVESIFKSEKEELDSIMSDTENTSDGTAGGISGEDGGKAGIFGDSFNFLIVTTDYMPGVFDDYILSAEDAKAYSSVHPAYTLGMLSGRYHEPNVSSIVLVRADKENSSFVYLYLSPYLRVSTTAGNRSLSEVYYTFGMDRMAEHISALTGLEIDYTFFISGYNLEGLTNTAGTVLVNNPKDIYTDGIYNTYAATTLKTVYDVSGEPITATFENDHLLAAGDTDMTATKLYIALSVIEHSKADLGTKQTVATSVAEEYMKLFASLSQSKLSETLSNLIGDNGVIISDFNLNEIGEVYDLLRHAGDFESVKLAYPCTYRPATDNIAEYFKPDVEKGLELLEKYRKSESN